VFTNRLKKEVARAIIDIEDVDRVSKISWYYHNKQKRAYTFHNGRKWGSLTSFIMDFKTNQNLMLDHRNRNTLDNRKNNLRFCTKRQNQCNTQNRKNNTTGYQGVYPCKDASTWYVRVNFYGKSKHIGSFKSIKEAAFAYNEAALKYHGEFACLNKVF
jgi:hypothetical protein